MVLEKITYDTQYPYRIRGDWDDEVYLTKEDLPKLRKALDKLIKEEYNKYTKRKEVNDMTTTIFFDMDGTLADFYKVAHWLDSLVASDTHPYEVAEPMLRFSALARVLNNLQRKGLRLAIVSWTSKSGTAEFNARVAEVKKNWLATHLPSVHWDEINIIPYGTPKQNYAHTATDILFDDEQPNRQNWTGFAYDANEIMQVLKAL